jgi:hypothetical protein
MQSKSVWTIVNDQFTAPLYDISTANEKDFPPFIGFRGNDAIGLMKVSAVDTVLIDVIGIPDINPGSGWDVAGVLSATANHSMIRKSHIEFGNTNWNAQRGSDATDSEWIIKDTDFADSLGHHFFRPTILISSIKLSNSSSDSIKTDLGTLQLKATILPASATDVGLIWNSSAPLVASVNQVGLVQAFNDGSAWIVATSTDGSGIADSVKITTVNQSGILPVNSITIEGQNGQDTIRLNKGTIQMLAVIKPANATNKIIDWSVDNTVFADINQNGLLTAKKNGKVMVTAKSTDGSVVSGSKTIVIIGQYSEVKNLTDLRAAYSADETVYRVSGEIVLSHWIYNRNTKYFQDNTAAIQIDDEFGKITSKYKVGDGITGLIGFMEDNYGMLQFHPIEDPGPVTSGNNSITPVLLSASEFNSNFEPYESRLVKIDHLKFDQAGELFTQLTNYTMHVGNDIVVFRTEYANTDFLGLAIPDSANVTGIAIQLNTTPKIAARKFDDIDILPLPKTNTDTNVSGEVRIFPNPVVDELNIFSPVEIDYYEIIDISGRTVIKGKKLKRESIIYTGTLQKGIYILNAYTKNDIIEVKFIKQ